MHILCDDARLGEASLDSLEVGLAAVECAWCKRGDRNVNLLVELAVVRPISPLELIRGV